MEFRMPQDNPVIVCASDEAFAVHMTVMLKSVVETSSKPITIFVLDGGIHNETKLKIEKSLQPAEFNLEWIAVDESRIKQLKVSGHIPVQTYYRLLMPELLPNEINKVI